MECARTKPQPRLRFFPGVPGGQSDLAPNPSRTKCSIRRQRDRTFPLVRRGEWLTNGRPGNIDTGDIGAY